VIFVAFLIGTALITAVGWYALRAAEGSVHVLWWWERAAAGFVLGSTLSMFAVFLAAIAGMPLTRWTFCAVLLGSLACIAIPVLLKHRMQPHSTLPTAPSHSLSIIPGSLLFWGILLLALWTAVKVATGAVLLTATPPFQDDVINNWNFRGKVFYYAQEFTLELQRGYGVVESDRVSSYPPSVPLLKTWYASLYGTWHEGLVNAMHILWYLCALLLLFGALCRMVGTGWALIGAYALSSIPLYLIHGSVAYADLFVSIHLFFTLSQLLLALRATGDAERSAHLRLGALALALLTFTKNEGIALYLPILALVAATVFLYMRRKGAAIARPALWTGTVLLIIAGPWLLYKFRYGLPFGNAKAVSGLQFAWQPGVLRAVFINLFFEGNWLLFMPLFVLLLLREWRSAFAWPLLPATGFILLAFLAQMGVFLFTSVSVEALNQTGVARGVIQLLPIMVMLAVLLTRTWWLRHRG